MSKRDLFEELSTALNEAKQHSEGRLTLKTHAVADTESHRLEPDEIVQIRERFNMSRGVFARYLHTSVRTLESLSANVIVRWFGDGASSHHRGISEPFPGGDAGGHPAPVSYTHLTLPTMYTV